MGAGRNRRARPTPAVQRHRGVRSAAERFGWPTDGHAGLDVRRLTIVGGGTKGALWRQIKADVTGLPVRVPTSVETTATGAAILTAVGAGVHASVAEAVAAFVDYQPDEHVPDPERHQLYSSAYHRYREVYYALKPVFEKVET